jgi:two-component system, cell cycle sensor histidine kinase and response regulator CckA
MRHVLRWYLAAGGLLAVLGAVLAPYPDLASIAWAVSALAAAGAIAFGLRVHRPRRPRFWIYVACAVGSWGVAAAVYPLAGLYASATRFHLVDILYAPGYIGLAAASVSLVRRFGGLRAAGADAAIGTLALCSFLWPLVLHPGLHRGVSEGIAVCLFPLCDVVLMLVVLRLLYSTAARLPSVRFLAAAAACLVVGDIGYFSPVIANGELAGRVLDATYVAAYILFGAAGLHRSMRRVTLHHARPDEIAPRRLLAVLACAPLTLPLALLVEAGLHQHLDAAALAVLGTATLALVLVRIAGLVRHLDALRVRAEASEQRFRMVFDSAAHGISIGSNGMMTETNAAYQQMLGYTGDELSRLHYTETTHPDDLDVAVEASEEVMSGQRRSTTYEKRLVRRDGSSFWVSVTLSRARDGSFGMAVIDDITARKELEIELRQAQKMEAVGKLAGGIAHDFNNVMTAVSGCADLLLSELDFDDPRRSRVEVIAQSAERATNLTRQLLAFSRRQVLRLEPIDLAEVVGAMDGMLCRLLPPNIGIDYSLGDGAFARVDRPQLEQVLLNLALNARDAMPRGGRLVIGVRADGDAAELTVADDGIGIDADTLERIFEPFFTTKRNGTGLGLSTVDGIVGQSGGTTAVESTPGRGTTFTIRLPRVDEPLRAAPEPPAEEPPVEPPAGRVLLADDEDLVRLVTAELLQRLGYEVMCASCGEEALELLEGTVFDALVTDVAMTGMDGQTLARRARADDPSLPVLFVSGYPAEVLTGDRMLAEGDEVLTKPFTPGELASAIELVRRRSAELALV